MRRKRKALMPDAPLAPVPSEILDQFVRQLRAEAAREADERGQDDCAGDDEPAGRARATEMRQGSHLAVVVSVRCAGSGSSNVSEAQ